MTRQVSIEQQAYRLFPDWHVIAQFEAALPLYHLPIVTKVIEYQDLSAVTWYFLKAVSLGVDTSAGISDLLGLSEADIAIPGAEALRIQLIQYGEPGLNRSRPLVLTKLGWDVLREVKKQPVSRQKTIHVHFSPLVDELAAIESEVRTNSEVRKQGLYVLPQLRDCPTLQELELAEVRAANAGNSRSDGFDIIELVDLKPVWLEYLVLDCLVLRNPQTNEIRLIAFRRLSYLDKISTHLQRMRQQGIAILPQEVQDDLEDRTEIQSSLPENVTKTVEVVRQNEGTLNGLRQDLREKEAQRSATQLESEREDLLEQISGLKGQIDAACAERDHAIAEVTSQRVQFLSVQEHRPFLEQAIDTAKTELIVMSPWMNRRTVDGSLVRRVRAALERGVAVWIGYGSRGTRPDEDERSQRNADAVIRDLRGEAGEAAHNLRIVNLGAIHEKILVCDREFGVVGSFNWLSYRGDNDSGLRTETGVVLRDTASVESIATAKLHELAAGVRQ